MKKRDIELLLKKSKKKDEEIEMLRGIIATMLDTSEQFVQIDLLSKGSTGKHLPKETYRAFIEASYQSLSLSKDCKNVSEMSVALMEQYNMAVEKARHEKA